MRSAESSNAGVLVALLVIGQLCVRPPHEATSDIMITSAIPVIAVSESVRSEDYYCRVLGFQKMFAYRPDPNKSDPCYLGVARDGVWLHLQSFKRERAGMTDAFLWVADVDLLYVEVSERGAVVQLPPTNQTWGTRETGIRDPDGNVLVFAAKPPDANVA